MKVRQLATVSALLALFAAGASPALAETQSGWFHLASVARPGNLHADAAQNEVQVLTVSATGGEVVLVETKTFTPVFFKWNASAEEVQAALEGVYGAGNVEVSGGPGDEEGTKPYVITFTGELANTPVEPMNAEASPFFLTCGEAPNCEGRARLIEDTKGRPADGYVIATAVNVGEVNVDGSITPVKLVDKLPEGLVAISTEATTISTISPERAPVECSIVSVREVECSFAGKLSPFQQIELAIGVKVQAGARSGELNAVQVSGGEAPQAQVVHPIVVSDSSTPFGVEDYALSPEEVGGGADGQAGSHPFQLTTTFNLKQVPAAHAERSWEGDPAALPKDLAFKLPAGLIGNPTAVPRCTLAQFNGRNHEFQLEANLCPIGSVVGVATSTFKFEHQMETATEPVFNLDPAPGEPARFGFQPAGVPVILDTSVRTGEDYGVTVTVQNVPQTIGSLSNTVTLWGVPGDRRHDSLRGIWCLAKASEDPVGLGPCRPLEAANPLPFLSLPTSCSGARLETSVTASSWADPGAPVSFEPEGSERMPAMHGCGLLPFSAEISLSPDVPAASSPSGLRVDVHVPQDEALNHEGLAPADVKNITVKLPQGLALNPSAADGLEACSLAQIGFKGENATTHLQEFTPDEPTCPNASKIATVTLKLPILPHGQNVTGFLYLAAPQNFSTRTGAPLANPFGSLLAMYLVAKDPVSGILVKLPGQVELSSTGQITASFKQNPQAPFEDAEIEFFGGLRAPLATPSHCASYIANALFEPWSNTIEHTEVLHMNSSPFLIASGPNGTPCPGATLPFSPSLASQSININAGNFTELSTTLSREDGQQPIDSVTLHYPPGLSGILKGIPPCPEAQANAGTCSAASKIGETTVSVGVGGDPFSVKGGSVYLTEKYQGAPFGLSIVNPAQAGPFDLQEGQPVIVRAKIEIDPHTAALTITTGNIPPIIDGFPLQIQHVNVLINRPGFTFNPTNCTPMAIVGQVNGLEGASSPVSVPFQVTNCAMLKFTPKLTVSTKAHTSKALGASLTTKLTEPAGAFGTQANIREVKVDLPKQLPSQLKTLQKACLASVFEANHAACPPQSIVGHATVTTPLLPVPLTGPAYFVSHGGEAFPSLTLVLQGYGVTVELVGSTFIKKGITSSTFKSAPDTPFNTFELTLPQGPYAALAANLPSRANNSFCGQNLKMPTLMVAQNGLEIHQSTRIAVTGCHKHHISKLQAALKRCNKKHGRARARCVAAARKRYARHKK